MKIELGLGKDLVVFADLEIGRACLMYEREDALYVKVGDVTVMEFEETDYGGTLVTIVAHPEDEVVRPMDLVGIQARPRGT